MGRAAGGAARPASVIKRAGAGEGLNTATSCPRSARARAMGAAACRQAKIVGGKHSEEKPGHSNLCESFLRDALLGLLPPWARPTNRVSP